MSRPPSRRALAMALLLLLCAATGVAAHSWDGVARRLKRAGGAKVTAVQHGDSSGGADGSLRMEILLSAKGSARVERADKSNILVVRPDGGEILDHRHKQLIRLAQDDVRRAAGVWTLFLSDDASLEEQPLGRGRSLVLLPQADAATESVWVRVGADSLPTRLDFGPDRSVTLDLAGWTFVAPPPSSRFHLKAPAGYDVVDWP